MKEYEEKDIIKNAYIDIIRYVGEKGMNVKIKIWDILPILTAPYTQFITLKTNTSGMRMIASELKSYLSNTLRSFGNMTYENIIAALQEGWMKTLTPDKMAEIACNFSLIDSVDDEGYVIFKEPVWKLYEGFSKKQYTKVEYGMQYVGKKYDFMAEQNVYTIDGKRVRIWTLNTENRNEKEMMLRNEVVIYNEYESTRKIHSFTSSEKYMAAYFWDKNNDEKFKDWDHYIHTDLRCHAYWRFCKVVKENDIIYLAQGSFVYGYCVITGTSVKSSETQNSHKWKCEWTAFDNPILVDDLRPTPFFMYVDHSKMDRIRAAGASCF